SARYNQFDRLHRTEQNPTRGPHGGHLTARATCGEMVGVQLARPDNRRARLPPDPRGDRRGPSDKRATDRRDLPDRERQRRLVHGEQDQVSRCGDERRRTEARPRRARSSGGSDLTAGPWKMESQRSYFGKALIQLGRRNPDVVVVGADTTESIKTIDFGKAFPDRLFQLGIAEPNMISVAAGLAAAGKIAFAATYSVFGSGHTYNVIRQNVAYTNLNVKIFCSHAGLTVGPDGATHQMNEDIALMRGIPRMTVLVPGRPRDREVRRCGRRDEGTDLLPFLPHERADDHLAGRRLRDRPRARHPRRIRRHTDRLRTHGGALSRGCGLAQARRDQGARDQPLDRQTARHRDDRSRGPRDGRNRDRGGAHRRSWHRGGNRLRDCGEPPGAGRHGRRSRRVRREWRGRRASAEVRSDRGEDRGWRSRRHETPRPRAMSPAVSAGLLLLNWLA